MENIESDDRDATLRKAMNRYASSPGEIFNDLLRQRPDICNLEARAATLKAIRRFMNGENDWPSGGRVKNAIRNILERENSIKPLQDIEINSIIGGVEYIENMYRSNYTRCLEESLISGSYFSYKRNISDPSMAVIGLFEIYAIKSGTNIFGACERHVAKSTQLDGTILNLEEDFEGFVVAHSGAYFCSMAEKLNGAPRFFVLPGIMPDRKGRIIRLEGESLEVAGNYSNRRKVFRSPILLERVPNSFSSAQTESYVDVVDLEWLRRHNDYAHRILTGKE